MPKPVPGSQIATTLPAAKLFHEDDWTWHRNPEAAALGLPLFKPTLIWKYFIYDSKRNLSRCIVGECTHTSNGSFTSSLKWHLKKHPKVFADFLKISNTPPVTNSPRKLLSSSKSSALYQSQLDPDSLSNILKKPDAEHSSSEKYEVEAIREMKIIKGEKWFLVKWKNYADSDNTWEPESAFIEAQYMIKRFLNMNQDDLDHSNIFGDENLPEKELYRRRESERLQRKSQEPEANQLSSDSTIRQKSRLNSREEDEFRSYSLRKRIKEEVISESDSGTKFKPGTSQKKVKNAKKKRKKRSDEMKLSWFGSHKKRRSTRLSARISSVSPSKRPNSRSIETSRDPIHGSSRSKVKTPLSPIHIYISPISSPKNSRMTPPQINNSTLCVSIQSSAFLSEDNLPNERSNEVVLTPPPVFAVSPRTPKLAVVKTPDATLRRSVRQNLFRTNMIKIVSARSALTRDVENEDTSVKLAFPHADSVAPVVEQQDPEHLSNEDIALIKSKIDDQFSNLFNRLQDLRSNAILNLLLVDTLLIGLNEASLADFFVIRAEFPFMPSWLINVLSKKKKLLNLMSLKVNTIFYMLGYDMLRMFKADTTEFVVNLMLRAINDFIGTVLVLDNEEEDGEERKMKTFVLITIPSIGILRDTIRVFNQGMHNELLKLRNEYKNKVTIELIDWENLVEIASKNGSLSNINTVDDRIKLLFNEIETRFS